MKHRIGLIVMATGKYFRTFFPPLFDSMQKYFFPAHDVRVFLFTDQNVDEAAYEAGSVQVIRIVHGPWPDATLRRYEYIDDNRRLFRDRDYLFWCDADMRIVSKISEEILPDGIKSGLVGVLHPIFSSISLRVPLRKTLAGAKLFRFLGSFHFYPWYRRGPYEINEKSTACVRCDEGDHYYMGAFWGGRTPEILQMSATLRHNTERDLSWGHVALWHDESHLNRYFIDHPPKMLSPSFCYPEGWRLFPVEKKILALNKNHDEMREVSPSP